MLEWWSDSLMRLQLFYIGLLLSLSCSCNQSRLLDYFLCRCFLVLSICCFLTSWSFRFPMLDSLVPLRRIQSVSWCSRNSGIPSVYVTRGINRHGDHLVGKFLLFSKIPLFCLDSSLSLLLLQIMTLPPQTGCRPCVHPCKWKWIALNCPNNPSIASIAACKLFAHLGGERLADYNSPARGGIGQEAVPPRCKTQACKPNPRGFRGRFWGELLNWNPATVDKGDCIE